MTTTQTLKKLFPLLQYVHVESEVVFTINFIVTCKCLVEILYIKSSFSEISHSLKFQNFSFIKTYNQRFLLNFILIANNPFWFLIFFQLYGLFFKDRIQLYQGWKGAMRRQLTLNRQVSRKSWYSLDQTRKNEKLS